MQENRSMSIIVAYTPEEYAKIRAIAVDRDEMEQEWAQWRQRTDEERSRSAGSDAQYVEQLVDAAGLLAFCQREGRVVDAQARSDYARLLYEKQTRESRGKLGRTLEQEPLKAPTLRYSAPVSELLTYTSLREQDPLPKISYSERFGIDKEHIADLIGMATDEYLLSQDASIFEMAAPLHAVRALAELHAEQAIAPLLMLYDTASRQDHEWMLETLLDVFITLGPVTLPQLEQFLVDPRHEEDAKHYVVEIVGRMGERYPEVREECIAMLTRRLAAFESHDPEFNGSLVSALLGLQAVEAAPLIQQAYASDCVDEMYCGDWKEVQYELGLSERPPQQQANLSAPPLVPVQSQAHSTNTTVQQSRKKPTTSKKAKSKMVRASKKVNRRKR